jgi:N-acetylmuramoyl-L-alanine amidase
MRWSSARDPPGAPGNAVADGLGGEGGDDAQGDQGRLGVGHAGRQQVDPGHGGEDGGDKSTQPADYKAGPTGQKEAFMNLRVGLLLRRLLSDAGVNVIMTRQGDDTLSLKERAEVANNATRPDGGTGADLFISLHHNAVNNPETNYSTTWYHGSVDNNEVELDVAEPIAHALGRALRTQVAKTSPVLSSQLMYPGGFGVLRQCKVPAILLESSFYTDPAEEQRLRDAAYNLREAYGIYVGLCEWAYGGRPTQSTPVVTLDGSTMRFRTTLSDGLPAWWGADRNRILTSSVSWTVDGQEANGHYDPVTHELEATWFHDPAGGLRRDDRQQYVITLHHANMFGHHNWPQRYRVTIAPDGETGGITVEPLGPVRDVYRAPAAGPATAPTTR